MAITLFETWITAGHNADSVADDTVQAAAFDTWLTLSDNPSSLPPYAAADPGGSGLPPRRQGRWAIPTLRRAVL